MNRMVKRLSNLEIDEVSLVDRPANQHGLVAIAKAHSQEDSMSVFDAEGREVFEDELNVGDYVYDEQGNEFQVTDGDDDNQGGEGSGGDEGEVGKGFGDVVNRGKQYGRLGRAYARRTASDVRRSDAAQHVGRNKHRYGYGATAAGAAGAGAAADNRFGKSLGDQVLESLSKALTDEDRDVVIAKMAEGFEDIAKRNEMLEETVIGLLEEREIGMFSDVAKGYGLAGEDADLGGLLFRASQVLPEEDVIALDRILGTAGEIQKNYFEELGVNGGTENSILGQVYAMAGEAVVKNAELGLTQEQAVTALFSENPAAYDEYEAEQGFGR